MEKQTAKLNVKDIIGSDIAVSTVYGDILYKKIIEAFSQNKQVELDFSGIDIITTAFLNAAIGQLYSSYKGEKLNKSIKLINIADEDILLLKKVIQRAKEYFSDRKKFEDSANIAVYGS